MLSRAVGASPSVRGPSLVTQYNKGAQIDPEHAVSSPGQFRMDLARYRNCVTRDGPRTDGDADYNTRKYVKFPFFLRIVTLWGLLKPPTPPIPHKSTHSGDLCGLCGVACFQAQFGAIISRKSPIESKRKKMKHRAPIQ